MVKLGAIYNIVSGLETSDRQMFYAMAKLHGYQGQPVFTKERHGEIHRICLNATRARAELGWQARVPLEEGLQTTVAYYKNLLLKPLPAKADRPVLHADR